MTMIHSLLLEKIISIKVLLTWVVAKKLTIHHMDVKSAFINRILKENIYVCVCVCVCVFFIA
jgi:hypothetical protein